MQPTAASSQRLRQKNGIRDVVVSGIHDLPELTGTKQLSFKENAKVKQDDFASHPIGIISEGIVGLQHSLNDGRRSISNLFFAGDMLDFRLLEKVSGTYVCFSTVKITMFSVKEVERLCLENPQILNVLAKSSLTAWGHATNHSVDLAQKSSVEKLASFIFECEKRRVKTRQSTIHLPLKRSDIADYLGLRAETLCRAFAKLRKNQLIELNGSNYVRILDKESLKKTACGSL